MDAAYRAVDGREKGSHSSGYFSPPGQYDNGAIQRHEFGRMRATVGSTGGFDGPVKSFGVRDLTEVNFLDFEHHHN